MGKALEQNQEATVRFFINNKDTRNEFTAVKEYSSIRRILSSIKNGYSKRDSLFTPLLSYKADIIHLIDAHIFPSIKNTINWNKTKLIVTFRGFDTLVQPHTDPDWKKELLELYATAHQLHFVSKHLLEKAIELGAPRAKCSVIYQSVDPNEFKHIQLATQNDTINIISTGRLVWEKGYVYALEAIAQLNHTYKNIKYSIWGSGPDIHLLNHHIQRLGLTNCCILKGEGSKTELAKQLSESDLYILPSLSEGVPNSILEASLMGLPVISTTVGGIPEVVQHGKTGLLAAPANSDELAKQLEQLLLNKEYALSLGKAGHEWMNAHHTPTQEMNQWKSLYTQTIA
jgi:colanic acid/amylovoran biosynthesis glycosyltransferase